MKSVMDWLLVSCCGMMAWVTLCMLTGERMRREQQRTIDKHIADQATAPKKQPEQLIVLR